jgi:heme/copper-type cytochrome/quinol oxidase subunit 2
MNADDRFPLFLKILWVAVILIGAGIASVILSPASELNQQYEQMFLALVLIGVWIPVFVYALLGTFLWHEVTRRK